MAKRNSTRRRAQKPKFIEVEGHQLTPVQYASYELCLERRVAMDKGANPGQALRLGLDDFLSPHRPSQKIKKQLAELSREAAHMALAVGTMDNFAWFASPPSVRAAGCDLVKKLALELYNASAKLTAIAIYVEAEETTKLQDWLAQDQQVAQIGHLREVTHG
jgi:hypothetical protein